MSEASNCRMCDGYGVIKNQVPYGSTTVTETLACECMTEINKAEAEESV